LILKKPKKIQPGERVFHIFSQSWYARRRVKLNIGVVDEVEFGVFDPTVSTAQNGCFLTMQWIQQSINNVVPSIKAWRGSWKSFRELEDLFEELADLSDEYLSVDDFVIILRKLGFNDVTPYHALSSKVN